VVQAILLAVRTARACTATSCGFEKSRRHRVVGENAWRGVSIMGDIVYQHDDRAELMRKIDAIIEKCKRGERG